MSRGDVWQRNLGANVVEAKDGMEALGLVTTEPFDLVICNLSMPRMNGLEFLKSMRSIPEMQDTPVIILTTKEDQPYRQQADILKVKEYMIKPFNPGRFRDVVGAILK